MQLLLLITSNRLHSKEMATKSMLDVFHLNEAKNDDMLEVMCKMAAYLGPEYQWTVLCGDDQLITERETTVKQHQMDSDTCIEDWHCLLNFLEVGHTLAVVNIQFRAHHHNLLCKTISFQHVPFAVIW